LEEVDAGRWAGKLNEQGGGGEISLQSRCRTMTRGRTEDERGNILPGDEEICLGSMRRQLGRREKVGGNYDWPGS